MDLQGEKVFIPLQEDDEQISPNTETLANEPSNSENKPIVVLVIGMAGSGKTTLMQRINLHMIENGLRGYYINLDPAVRVVPFSANIDIRDTVNYKEVMKEYRLGPNGAILTSLNLFATRFDQVLGLLERRASTLDYIFIDTPGQIEAFTWSAGGQVIHELLSTSFPTVMLYVLDTPRCASPTTFMSNMLYACSILYKSRLPLICAFNKVDVVPFSFAREWMQDFEAYQRALDGEDDPEGSENADEEEERERRAELARRRGEIRASGREDYLTSLNRSLCLAMDEFYNSISTVGVSAAEGEGMEELFEKLQAGRKEFEEVYWPELQSRVREANERKRETQEKDLEKLRKDLQSTRGDRENF